MSQNPLIIRYLLWIFPIFAPLIAAAAEPKAIASDFDPQKGFKPAQRSLQPIFLQMGGSFEAYGTPANYLRHVNAEAKRVEAAWLKAKGKPAKFRPEYFTDQYVEKLITGWNQMAPVLALESFTRNSGRQMRYAIMGTDNVSPAELAAGESKLTKDESAEFRRLLAKPSFKNEDMGAIDAFYRDGSTFDKLSEPSKAEVNKRVWRGLMESEVLEADIIASKRGTTALAILGKHQRMVVAGIERGDAHVSSDQLRDAIIEGLQLKSDDLNIKSLPTSARDAVVYSHAIKGALVRRVKEVSKQTTAKQLAEIDAALMLVMENLVVAAQLELETGLWDEALNR